MNSFRYSKKLHRWSAIIFLLPMLIIFVTGVVLMLASKSQTLQPVPPKLENPGLTIGFDKILNAARTVDEAGIKTWNDVVQIDVRPKTGVVRVRSKNYWEVQIDGTTGAVVGSGKRWKTLLVLLHDGSWFGTSVKYGVYLTSSLAILILWVTGTVLFVYPYFRRRKEVDEGF